MNKLTILPLLLTLIMALTLSGCGDSLAHPVENVQTIENGVNAVCFAIAHTANAREINFDSPVVRDTALDVVENYGYISVIRVDSAPEQVPECSGSYDIQEKYKKASETKLKSDARTRCTRLLMAMREVHAIEPEVDYLEALRVAARSLSGDTYRSRTIIMLGTGLSTSGLLDFRNNLFYAEPKAVLDMLDELQAIPDLQGIHVIFQHLGDTAAPQEPLSPAQREWLRTLYQGLVERGGGTFDCCDILSMPVDTDFQLPAVSVVELPKQTLTSIPMPAEAEAEAEETGGVEMISLGEKEIQFKPDTAEFLDREAALETLRPLAELLLRGEPETLLLAGCIAGDDCGESGYRLSRQRAETVMAALEELGLPADRMLAVGLGCSAPWQIKGVGYDGPLAQENRRVVLMDAKSPTAQVLVADLASNT